MSFETERPRARDGKFTTKAADAALGGMGALELMDELDRASTVFGDLKPEVRARLFEVVDHTTDETWSEARSVVLDGVAFDGTLWRATLAYTDYRGATSEAAAPTNEQVREAIRVATHPDVRAAWRSSNPAELRPVVEDHDWCSAQGYTPKDVGVWDARALAARARLDVIARIEQGL